VKRFMIFAVAAALDATSASAVNDAALLTQRSETASTTVKLVPVTTDRQKANSGVKCAVTTGRRANIANPTVQPQNGAGAQAIRSYAPDLPTAPDPSARGAALSSQTLAKSSGDVVAGLDASRSTINSAQTAFRTAGSQAGTAPTVMAAIDMNSAARVENGLSWNGAISSTNLWLTALNALNLAETSDASRAAAAMRMTGDGAASAALTVAELAAALVAISQQTR
jgi:hypothetical protein